MKARQAEGDRDSTAPDLFVESLTSTWSVNGTSTQPVPLEAELVVHPPGRTAPHHRVRPWPSLMVVVLIVFCLRLPGTKAARPGRPAFGRRTWG
jgi:hypothetical protein